MIMNKLNLKLVVLLISVFMLTYAEKTFSQDQTVLNSLMNRVWVLQFPSKQDYTVKVTYDKCVETYVMASDSQSFDMKATYYLSDKIVSEFDSTKVGKCYNGKYIILQKTSKDGKIKDFNVLEILELSAIDLKVKSLSNNSIIPFKVE